MFSHIRCWDVVIVLLVAGFIFGMLFKSPVALFWSVFGIVAGLLITIIKEGK